MVRTIAADVTGEAAIAMESWEERIARRLEEIKAKEEALDREGAERQAEAERRKSAVVRERERGRFRGVVVIAAVFVMSAVLIGVSVTLTRLAGRDFADARRAGQASVTACADHGPVSLRGFGYWDQCAVSVVWDDGNREMTTVGGVFTAADIGTPVRVGDMGRHRTETVLSRADVPERPWLRWIGYVLGFLGGIPLLLVGMMLGAMLRYPSRR